MNILIKNIGFFAVLCAVAPAFGALRSTNTGNATGRPSAADSRVSIASPTTAAMRRLPTLLKTGESTAVVTTADTSSSLLTRNECVEQYTDCIKDSAVCGNDFEECTTKPLFYAKKAQCNGVLLQCGTDGISALFGTSDTTAFSNKDTDGNFIYPTDGSILGQFIEAGHISNLLDTSQCVKKVVSCLHKDNVCGADFELCTSNTEFKKQKLFCESTLARCQSDGIAELFGVGNSAADNPSSTSRLGIMISEGQQLAAANAVSTCYKVANQCILSACGPNPYKCITDASFLVVKATDATNSGDGLTADEMAENNTTVTTRDISGFIMNSCLDTIGGNKYCYAIKHDGHMPTAAQLMDPENREEVYTEVYTDVMNDSMRQNIRNLAEQFDRTTKDKCRDTMVACALRSCGGGIGSVCYQQAFGNVTTGSTNADNWDSNFSKINMDPSYRQIARGCEAIVNADATCQYAAAVTSTQDSVNNVNQFGYAYIKKGVFNQLFQKADQKVTDPIGVYARLNKYLSEKYNDAALEKMAKQCKNTATSCIRSLCGADFTNCYRNRTDIMTDTYNTEQTKFNQSMNKVGGVLDLTIVRGLCLETVKSSKVCEEHLKIQGVRYATSTTTDDGTVTTTTDWGTAGSVRDAWVNAAKDGYSADLVTVEGEYVETGLCTIDQSKASNSKCKSKLTDAQECDTVDEDGCLYDVEQVVPRQDYQVSMAADTLFQEVMGDLEKEAQAKYNAKLTQEQNMCIASNNGGIMGRNDMASTYMWVKLRSRKVPKNYATSGLDTKDFVASNDLYGSFCRARVTVQSDDPDIQSALQSRNNNWSTAYFAVGDVFTCGSWIPQDKLQEIATMAACKKAKSDGTIDSKTDCKDVKNVHDVGLTNGQKWAVAGTGILSFGAGAGAMDLLQGKTGLGGLMNTGSSNYDTCASEFETAKDNASRFASQVTAGGCYTFESDGVIRKSSFGSSITKRKLKTITPTEDRSNCLTAEQVGEYVNTFTDTKKKEVCGSESSSLGWRLGADAISGAVVSGISTLAVRDAIREGNRKQFTADEQAFMREVGDHIYCFIGAEEAGNYGDLIEISLD